MLKNNNIIFSLFFLLFIQYIEAQVATLSLQYDTSGYKESQQISLKGPSTPGTPDYRLIPAVNAEMHVNESGALTYTIPIEGLKGVNNFQPNIALAYNSQSGNGTAGWGWNIVGISMISQGGRSKETDGITIGSQFDNNDPYYLDGQRLLKKNDTDYVLQTFSKIKITKTTGLYSFLIQYTDGKVAWYRELTPGQHYIVRMADAFNNEIHYSYTIANNTSLLSKVSYGGTDVATDKFYIDISYIDRKYAVKIYRNEKEYINNKVVSEIKTGSTYSGNYRKYTLAFDFIEANSIERLRTVTVYNESGESLKPLNFNYNTPSVSATAEVKKQYFSKVQANTYKLGDTTVGNFYNNNENDIFYISATVTNFSSGAEGGFGSNPTSAQPGNIANPIFYLNSPYGTIAPSSYINFHSRLFAGKTLINDNKVTTNDQLIIVNPLSKTSDSQSGVIEIRDFKTGKIKLLSGGPSIPWVTSGFSGGPQFTTPPRTSQKFFIPGDFNNDGLFELIYIEGNTASTQKLYLYEIGKETSNTIIRKEFTCTSLLLSEDNFRLVEIDGDGIAEIMVTSGNQYGIYKINAKDMTIKPFGNVLGQTGNNNILNDLEYDNNNKLITPLFLGDFNGDGLTDFMTPKTVFKNATPFSRLRADIENSQLIWWLYTSDGKKFIPKQINLTQQKIFYIKPSQDQSVPSQSAWDLFLWGQDPVQAKEYATGNILVTDINNDGKSDLVAVSKFGKILFNTSNPLISDFTYESVPDTYRELVYDKRCFNSTGQSFSAISQQSCTSEFPIFVTPTYQSNIAPTPGVYETSFPNFNKINFFLNTVDTTGNIIFNKLNQVIDLQNEKITPYSIFLSSQDVNFLNTYKISISNSDVTTGTNFKITFNNDNFLEKQIQEVNNGSTVVQKIEYRPMMKLDTKEELCYQYKDNNNSGIQYPLYIHQTNGTLYLVNKIHTLFSGNILTKEYRYENAIQHLDGKGFLGFQKTYASDAYESSFTNGKYRNKKPTKTLLWKIQVRDPLLDNSLIKSAYGGINSFLTETSISNKKYQIGNQSLILSTDEFTRDYLRKIIISKKYIYDEADDLKLKKSFTDYNGESTSEATFSYQPEFLNGQHYFYGKITEQKNTVYKDGLTFVTKEVSSYYPDNGSIQETKKYSQNSESVNTSFVYDSYGNVTSQTLSTAGIASQTTTYGYDVTNRYLTSTTTPDGLTSSALVNALGRTSEETAALGNLKTYYTYDSWGNITSITDYLGKTTTITKSVSAVSGGIYQLSKKREAGTETIVVFDELDREILSKTQSINGKWVVSSTEYDIFGRKIKQSQPFFEGETPKWNTVEYDIYNRPVKNISYTGKIITTCYEGLKVTADDGYQKTSKTLDATGNTVRYQDHGGVINYSYYPNGSLKETNYEGSKTTFEIDDWGNKKKMVDPSAGTFTYQYDNLGRLTREDNPKGYTLFEYDNLGRPVFEKTYGNTPAENTSVEKYYQYNATTKLPQKIYGTSNGKNFTYTTEYDQYFRIKGKKEETPDFIYVSNTTFDPFGRADEVSTSTTLQNPNYTTSSKVKNVYDSNGILIQQNDVLANATIWHISAADALGRTTQMEYGNGYALNTYYNLQDDGLFKIIHSNGSNTVLDIDYVYNVNKGVLNSRKNNTFGKTENFEYDTLNRLLKETVNGTVTNEYTYDKRGRMTGNTELGQYNYNGNDYKLQNIAFNANGQNLNTQRGFAEVTYNAFKAPLRINLPNKDDLKFEYNLLQSRYRMYSETTGKQKFYSSDYAVEITKETNGKTQILTYITGDPYNANYIEKVVLNNGTVTEKANYFLHRDHLSSILAITKATDGAVVEKRFFDAWGNLKGLVNGGGQLITDSQQLLNANMFIDRGYTGHEHLMSVGLINMNARLYDPVMRRFLSLDSIIQDPFNTQNYNRYGYVTNNPLLYTDPSGNTLVVAVIVAVAVSVTTHAIMNTLQGIPFWYGMGKAMTTGAISGLVSFGIGSAATSIFGEALTIGKAAFEAGMHAITGGLFSEMDGGKFSSGFYAGAISSLAASGTQYIGESGKQFADIGLSDYGIVAETSFGSRNPILLKALMITSGGLTGGISSTISGGNFWSGLRQGLITSGVNHVAHLITNTIISKNILAGYLVKNGVKPYDPASTTSLKAIIALFTSPGQWVKVADAVTLAEWSQGYLTATIDSNQLIDLVINGVPANNPAWGITNPVNGKIILAPRLLNMIEDNFWAASVVIHEQDHFINFKLGILQGNSYIEQELNELSAYRAAEKWTGIMEKQGFIHLNNVMSYFLKISNH